MWMTTHRCGVPIWAAVTTGPVPHVPVRGMPERALDILLLRSWWRRRANLLRLGAPAGDIAELLADPRLVPSGISDPRSAMSAGNGAEGYVRRSDVEAVVRDYLMAESAEGNVWLHTADRSLLRPVPLGLVIADLADHDGPREDGVVEALLRSVPK